MPISSVDVNVEEAYKAVLENYPDYGLVKPSLLRLCRMNVERGRWVEAAMYHELYLQKFPEDERLSYILYTLGKCYKNMGEFNMAVVVYERFLKAADPDDSRMERVIARLEELRQEEE